MANVFENLSKWTEGAGPQADVVISSRIRLARNLAQYPFPHLLTTEQDKFIVDDITKVAKGKDFVKKLGKSEVINLFDITDLEKWVLVEKHLISPQHAQGSGNRAVVISDDETFSVMINEEDHVRIQCLLPAMQIHEAYQKANDLDDSLEKTLDFAFSKEHGYLTVCPTNVGTGLRASVMVHLPGLVTTKQAGRVLSALSQVGLAVRGTYGEGTESSGNLYQISNHRTLGKTEEEILNNITTVTQHIIEQEKHAREIMLKEIPDQLADRVWRAHGILASARLISSKEAINYLSELRLGIDLNIISDLDTRIFNELLVLIQPAFLQKQKGVELTPIMRDKARADIIREKIVGTKGLEEK